MLDLVGNAISGLQEAVNAIPAGHSLLFSITIIIVIAAVFAFISKVLKQELIPAYIIAGIIIGPLVLGLINNIGLINSLAEMGIAFLLFTAGLEISASKIKEQTGPSVFASIFEMVCIAVVTFLIAIALKFQSTEAIFLAIILAFSSTVLVVKLLSDKKELSTVHGRIAIGILLVQDIAAIIVLALMNQSFGIMNIILALLQTGLLILIAIFLNKTVLKPIFKFASSSYELLFLAALAFVFIFAALAYVLGLSIVIGAFVAGLAISNLPYKFEIENKIKPLRDFFTIIFFVSLGMWLTAFNFKAIIIPFLIFLAVIIFLKPLLIAIAVRLSRYKPRTSLGVGFSLGQISEFSLVVAVMAMGANLISNNTFNLVILLAIATMAITPYLGRANTFFFKAYHKFFNIFKKVPEKKELEPYKPERKTILLFGCHRMGTIFLKGLEKYKKKILVVDFNPDVVKAMIKQKISCIYGDAVSSDLLDILPVDQSKVVISTIPKIDENIYMIKYVKGKNKNVFVAVNAEKIHDAIKLYENGADYVIVPAVISGEDTLKRIIEMTKSDFKKFKTRHLKYLKELHNYLY